MPVGLLSKGNESCPDVALTTKVVTEFVAVLATKRKLPAGSRAIADGSPALEVESGAGVPVAGSSRKIEAVVSPWFPAKRNAPDGATASVPGDAPVGAEPSGTSVFAAASRRSAETVPAVRFAV
jgi:hypothetical protein